MSFQTYESLEFDEVRRILAGYLASPPGQRALAALAPFGEREALERELQVLEECRVWMEAEGPPALMLDEDPAPLLERVAVAGVVLEAGEVLLLAELGRVGSDLRKRLRAAAEAHPLLAARFAGLEDFSSFVAEIRRKIQPNGQLEDHASPELRRIRRAAESSRAKIQDTLNAYLQRDQAGVLQDQFITVRNGRYVLPVRADSPHRLEGVVHGTSSSGATLFIEPLKTVDLNNQLFRLQEQEREEVLRILREISEQVHGRLEAWRRLMDGVGDMDLLAARLKFAREFQAVIPRLAPKGELELVEARHPLLVDQSSRTDQPVVPISLHMGPSRQLLILSGPNTGGKTVALKTVGLLSLMACCGIPVTAADAAIPVFDRILVDIGDQQSIQSSLSTFSAHLTSLRDVLEQARPTALVLLDEIGTGTDPEQGAALAMAVLARLQSVGALVVATTHYNRLKAFGYETPGAANMAVEFDPEKLRPTYRLIDGVAGGSSGLEIAARLGLPEEVIRAARRLVDPADLEADRQFETVRRKLAELERERQELGVQRQLTEQARLELHQSYQQRRAELEAELEKRLQEQSDLFTKEANRVLRDVRQNTERVRLARSTERRLEQLRQRVRRKARPAGSPPAAGQGEEPRELRPGDRVRIISLELEGVVEQLEPRRAEVNISGKRWKIQRQDLEHVSGPSAPAPGAEAPRMPAGVVLELHEDQEIPRELILIGCTADEAIARTDKFLDQAALAQRDAVRLVHGYGKGKLRSALAEFLSGHPHVAGIHAAEADEGGQAVTVVQLRR